MTSKRYYTVKARIPAKIAKAGRGYHWQTGIPNGLSWNDADDELVQWLDLSKDKANAKAALLETLGAEEIEIITNK